MLGPLSWKATRCRDPAKRVVCQSVHPGHTDPPQLMLRLIPRRPRQREAVHTECTPPRVSISKVVSLTKPFPVTEVTSKMSVPKAVTLVLETDTMNDR